VVAAVLQLQVLLEVQHQPAAKVEAVQEILEEQEQPIRVQVQLREEMADQTPVVEAEPAHRTIHLGAEQQKVVMVVQAL
jgi:hypothetical protein